MRTILLLVALIIAIFIFIYYKRWENMKKLFNKIIGKNKANQDKKL